MRKITIIIIGFLSLCLLPLSANADHWVVRCHKPCPTCKKVCYKTLIKGEKGKVKKKGKMKAKKKVKKPLIHQHYHSRYHQRHRRSWG